MNRYLLIVSTLLLLSFSASSQIKQSIKGQVIDTDSEMTLIGANVIVLTADGEGSSTDLDGNFTIQNIPVGRHTVQVSYLGYSSVTIPNVVVARRPCRLPKRRQLRLGGRISPRTNRWKVSSSSFFFFFRSNLLFF